jgi:prepilin-type N-terminal cleavage/methylation domain-containing protein
MSFAFRASRFAFRPLSRDGWRRCFAAPTRRPKREARSALAAFTLIELMVVVGIMALVMAIGIPFMARVINGGNGITRAVRDVQEVCSNARALAILQQTTAELRIRPADGTFEFGAAAGHDQTRAFSPDVSGDDWRMAERHSSGGASGVRSSAVKLPDGVVIEGLGVNGEDWTEDAVAVVRFYRDGTSDEMSVVLYRPESGERRNVFLEVVTGLPDVESDERKFRVR